MENTNLITVLEGVIATLKKVNELETQVALANSQLRAIQESNNQLAEIAFDENKFTQVLMEKVDDLAREAARDSIDTEEIAREAAQYVEIGDEVQRHVDRLGMVTSDDVNDAIQDFVNDNDIATTSEVEDAISEYLDHNDYICKSDIQDMIQEEVNDAVDERTENIARRIAQGIVKEEIMNLLHKLIKENTNANDTNQNDSSIQLSGVVGQSQANGYGETSPHA